METAMTQRYGPGPHLEQLDGYSQKGIVCWLTKAVCVCFSFSGYSIDYIELKRRLPQHLLIQKFKRQIHHACDHALFVLQLLILIMYLALKCFEFMEVMLHACFLDLYAQC